MIRFTCHGPAYAIPRQTTFYREMGIFTGRRKRRPVGE